MTSTQKAFSLNHVTTQFYINQDIGTSYDQYDASGNATSKGFVMDQDGSAVTITGNNTSLYTILDCTATFSGWHKTNNQYAYSDETYGSTDIVRIDFTNARPSLPFKDMLIGFGGDTRIENNTNTYQFVDSLGSVDNFYFYIRNDPANTLYTILYDGNGHVSRYINGTLLDTTTITFNTLYAGGLKIIAVFNNSSQNDNFHYVVKLYQPTFTFPARSLLCRKMGKKYVLNNKTYLQVQNVADQNVFYIDTTGTLFSSLVL